MTGRAFVTTADRAVAPRQDVASRLLCGWSMPHHDKPAPIPADLLTAVTGGGKKANLKKIFDEFPELPSFGDTPEQEWDFCTGKRRE